MKYILTIVCALFLMPALCQANSIAQNNEDMKIRVENLVQKHYMDGIPYTEAHELGSEALPYLFELLNSPDDRQFWVNIIVTIGFIEDASAIDPLIAILEDTQGEVDSFIFRAMLSVPYALGCIASNGNAKAFQYLAGNLDEGKGQAPGWSFRGKPIADLIAEQSVMGLAVSGRPEARQLLQGLQTAISKQSGQKERVLLNGNVNQGLSIMDRIDTRGRAAVLNPQREE